MIDRTQIDRAIEVTGWAWVHHVPEPPVPTNDSLIVADTPSGAVFVYLNRMRGSWALPGHPLAEWGRSAPKRSAVLFYHERAGHRDAEWFERVLVELIEWAKQPVLDPAP